MSLFTCAGNCGKSIVVSSGREEPAQPIAGEGFRGAYLVCPKCFGHVCPECAAGGVCPSCGTLLVDVEAGEEAAYLDSGQQQAYQILLGCRGAILENHRSLLPFDQGRQNFLGEKVAQLARELGESLAAASLPAPVGPEAQQQLMALLIEQMHMAWGVPRILKMIESDFSDNIPQDDLFYFYGVEEALDYAHHAVDQQITGGLLVELLDNDAVLDQGLFICDINTCRRLGFDLIEAPEDVRAILNMITRMGLRLGLAEVLSRAESYLLNQQFDRLDGYLTAYFLRLAFIMTKLGSREEVQNHFRKILTVMAGHPDPAISRVAGELAAR